MQNNGRNHSVTEKNKTPKHWYNTSIITNESKGKGKGLVLVIELTAYTTHTQECFYNLGSGS